MLRPPSAAAAAAYCCLTKVAMTTFWKDAGESAAAALKVRDRSCLLPKVIFFTSN
jgi:hypothetical protein